MKTIAIAQATYVEKYKIHFIFSDQTEKDIDFSEFLNRAKNPMTRRFLDKNLFKIFKIEFGDIVWNDYELCFPISDLYEGRIH
jgi:hypothetical protein